MIAYTVRCTFEQPDVAGEWLAWLYREHVQEVCDAGAVDAEVIRLDGAIRMQPR